MGTRDGRDSNGKRDGQERWEGGKEFFQVTYIWFSGSGLWVGGS